MNFEIWSTVTFWVLHVLVAVPDSLRVEGAGQLETHGELLLAMMSSLIDWNCDVLIVDFLRGINFAPAIVPNVTKFSFNFSRKLGLLTLGRHFEVVR